MHSSDLVESRKGGAVMLCETTSSGGWGEKMQSDFCGKLESLVPADVNATKEVWVNIFTKTWSLSA